MIRRSRKDTAPTAVSHNASIPKRVLLENGEVDRITNFSIATFPVGERASAHSHPDMTEVFLVNRGAGRIVVDDVGYSIAAGDCITVEPGEVHELENNGGEPMEVIYFGVITPP